MAAVSDALEVLSGLLALAALGALYHARITRPVGQGTQSTMSSSDQPTNATAEKPRYPSRRIRRAVYHSLPKAERPKWGEGNAELLRKPNPCLKRFKMPDGRIIEMLCGAERNGVPAQIAQAVRSYRGPRLVTITPA